MDNQNLKSAKRWVSQASVDIKAAKWNLKGGFCEDACFLAQQAAEKALKGFLYFKGERSVVEHSVLFLVKRCLAYSNEFKKLLEAAKDLDKYYIPTRYPDSLPEGIPYDFFTKKEAEEAIKSSTSILNLVNKFLKQ